MTKTETERARTFDDVIITARCIDCNVDFTGPIGVHLITAPGGSPHLEIVIVDQKRNAIHAIARVDVYQIPVALSAPLQATGSA
jgi:hypothetical protein